MAGADLSEQTPVFDFMVVRAPETPDAADSRRRYIHDDQVVSHGGVPAREAVDLTSQAAASAIGRLVHQKVVCDPPPKDDAYEELLVALLKVLTPRVPVCGEAEAREPDVSTNNAGPQPLEFGSLDQHAHLEHDGVFYLLPDTLDQLTGTPLIQQLLKALALLEAERAAAEPDSRRLLRGLEALFDNTPLRSVVFQTDGAYTATFARAKRDLFDTLYLLFVLRRWAEVDLEQITDGLCALHVMEALAGEDKQANAATLRTLLDARPVVHPLFTRLYYYLRPFNRIRPIGIGDLKVVRQWLTAYRPGEISHVHNIVKGESKTRDHRRLERSEDVFSYSDTRSTETSTDASSTERFELKREAEQVLRTELNVNASANATLSYGTSSTPMRITASVGAGFAYNRASEEHTKTSQSFAREVVAKAVGRVESQTATSRSATRTFESEEKNQQVFDNRKGPAHVSGIYRWIDKEYTAQLFNYGKRLMFEFIVPEPAAFWVESKLRGYEAELDVPQPPKEPEYAEVVMPTVKDPLDRAEFLRLGQLYDLTGLDFPEPRTATLVNRENGQARIEETGLSADDLWITKTYAARLDGGKDHLITGLRLAGKVEYRDYDAGAPTKESDRNLFSLTANGTMLLDYDDTSSLFHPFWPMGVIAVSGPQLDSDEVTFTIGGQEVTSWRLTVDAVLTPGPRLLSTLRTQVLERVRTAETQRVSAANRKLELAYETELATYRNRLGELEAVTVAELLRGGSDAANRQVTDEEIKKHCLTMITKEFDSVSTDDVLSGQDALGTRDIAAVTTLFKVRPKGSTKEQTTTTAQFEHYDRPKTAYPAIDIKQTRTKGTVVQFLEQAFEWERLSYIYYPYYWAAQPRWIELMNRFDDADPAFASFLRAGMARVLVAVTPGYCDAVLHYLDSRQPWGCRGRAPVIGDKLFIPLHEEIRKQQDDLYGGTPEGEPWTFTVPTSLVYLHGSADKLPDIAAERARAKAVAEAAKTSGKNGGGKP
ncbi:hypothetical protein [Streptomyces sp. NPDC050564]|uniref:hypothetical protein n=1 Tax=Streptomyces sp. NPDC050564 TaxID=3365631 RepID=UPI0037A7D855